MGMVLFSCLFFPFMMSIKREKKTKKQMKWYDRQYGLFLFDCFVLAVAFEAFHSLEVDVDPKSSWARATDQVQ